jgi:riboflavin synthase
VFTGIIETIGTIKEIRRGDRSATIGILPDMTGYAVAEGGSVSVDGICLTLESARGNVLYFTAVLETLGRTTLLSKRESDRVNLERALPVSGRLDGHIVLGHVDATGTIVGDRNEGDAVVRTIRVPDTLLPFLAEKGSVAVDGISLTVAGKPSDSIAVSLVPFTLAKTTMPLKRPGDTVNIECDVIVRYCARLLAAAGGNSRNPQEVLRASGTSLLDTMERLGY